LVDSNSGQFVKLVSIEKDDVLRAKPKLASTQRPTSRPRPTPHLEPHAVSPDHTCVSRARHVRAAGAFALRRPGPSTTRASRLEPHAPLTRPDPLPFLFYLRHRAPPCIKAADAIPRLLFSSRVLTLPANVSHPCPPPPSVITVSNTCYNCGHAGTSLETVLHQA
jgi:hypothetical protein